MVAPWFGIIIDDDKQSMRLGSVSALNKLVEFLNKPAIRLNKLAILVEWFYDEFCCRKNPYLPLA